MVFKLFRSKGQCDWL